jgi:mRNA-degrading endonuclease toxin of MazEF toxin-antitoxin module
MLRGEIWWAKWPTDPTSKARPVLIVSNNFRNSAPNLHDLIVVKLTSLKRDDGSRKPTNPAEDVIVTLRKETIIRCASIFSVEKTMLQSRGGLLPIDAMKTVDEKLKHALSLE